MRIRTEDIKTTWGDVAKEKVGHALHHMQEHIQNVERNLQGDCETCLDQRTAEVTRQAYEAAGGDAHNMKKKL